MVQRSDRPKNSLDTKSSDAINTGLVSYDDFNEMMLSDDPDRYKKVSIGLIKNKIKFNKAS